MDGRYQVVKVLGSGGFSQTYVAEDTRRPSHPQCVVKHLKLLRDDPSFLQEVRTRFQTEAKALDQLGTHDQIPQLLACFEDNQELFLVLEFIEGHPLSDELAGKRLSEAEVIALLLDVLSGLKFVHSQQVVHRDIKPNNLIRRQRDGKIALIDFGAVKTIQPQITNSPPTIRIGTPGYTPPEQDAGNPGFNSDLYALGITAIQALTGLHPSQLVDADGQVSWQHKVEVSHGLAAILTRMVCRFSIERYQSAQECLDDLKKLAEPAGIASATVQVARPRSDKIFSRLITSDRTFFSSITGVSLLVLVVTGIVLESFRSQTAQATLSQVKRLQTEKKYQDCLDQAAGIVHSFGINPNLRNQAEKLLSQCQVAIAQQTIQQAKQLAASGKLVNAITTASQVSPDGQLAAAAQPLIAGWTQRLLNLGWNQYHAGKLDKAIAYADAIPATAPNYQTAQGIVTQWRENWQTAESQFNQAQQSLNQNQWQEAIDIARTPTPNNRFWQARLATVVQRAEAARRAEATRRTQRIAHTLELLDRDRDQVGRSALEKAYPDKAFKNTEAISELQVRRSGDQVTFRLIVISEGWFWTTETIAVDWQVMLLKKQHLGASISNHKKLDAYHAEELNNYFLTLAEQYL